jgi:hypothetical protein
LFEACLTVVTGSTRIHHAAHSNLIALFEFSHIETGFGDPTNDFMSRNTRVNGVVPFVACLVKVGMANATIEYLDAHIGRL